ncbi:hypothetical protein [Rhodococcus sp. SGAir0479]|uniref:hypothetical protein n=1 Tax=Rhodococcus sp. SGAir0479 TaxID=2567884 RepID=UPI0010CCB22E|nr:hypothetical protein [Rhodococcus sp. SGAir0479]QCQ90506.1 hypothetical protein E7742_04200 [Rhodococcus sp. SGAir0479]
MVWESLSGAVGAGELVMERGVARNCAERCSAFIEQLKGVQSKARSLESVDGFGGLLPSGVALAAKFERKATGGDYSLDRALADHIAVVEQMRSVFEAIESRYVAAEEANTTAVTAAGSQIN